jgi:hypothetical protein
MRLPVRHHSRVAGSPYSTARWQKLRRAVIRRDGQCMLRTSPNCRGTAETAHHVVAVAVDPSRFFDPTNVIASCGPCNFSHGAALGAAKRRGRIERLEEVIRLQETHIAELVERIVELEAERSRPSILSTPAMPAIFWFDSLFSARETRHRSGGRFSLEGAGSAGPS